MKSKFIRFVSVVCIIAMLLSQSLTAFAAGTNGLSNQKQISVGETITLKAGQSFLTKTTWSTSDDSIATVSNSGVVTGISAGEATVTAVTKGYFINKTQKWTITVLDQTAVGYEIAVGETITLTASASGKTKWTSSDKNIASVNKDGVVTGVAEGYATIKATTTTGVYSGWFFGFFPGFNRNKTTVEEFEIHVVGGPAPTETTEAPTEETTVPATYTVTFESNGGSAVAAQPVEEGMTATEPETPEKEGYTFAGWYTDAELTNVYDFATPVTANVTLYAKWEAIPTATYLVTFNSNGGSVVETQIVEEGMTATEPQYPILEGYAFAGWFNNAELTVPYDFDTPVTTDVTLYAKWEKLSDESSAVTGSASSVDVFSISSLRIDNETGTAVATVSAPENCALVIRFIEEDNYFSKDYPENKQYISEDSLYASHVVRAGTDMEQVIADIVGELPVYYVAEAVLMDGNMTALCNPVTFIEHTQRYEQFKQKTVYDFGDTDTVLNFDSETDNNFGVLADDVRVITVQDLAIDEETDAHYLTGVAETITTGDKLFISDGIDHALIRVKEISEDSGIVTLIPANADDGTYGFTLEDFYKFIKVDMDYDGDMVTDSNSGNAENKESAVALMSLDVIDTNVSAETSLSINPIAFETTYFRATGKVGGKISANLVMEWDLVLFGKDYMRCDFTYSTDLNANIAVTAKLGPDEDNEPEKETRELRLGKVRIPFGVTGLDAFADIKACIEWEITAGLDLSGTIKTTHGFKYNTKDGGQKIDQKNATWTVNCKGHAEISFGPKPSVGVEFLDGVISCELECFFGAKAEGNAVVPVFNGGDSKHSCYLCIDGNVKMAFTVDAKMKYKITDHLKGTPIDWNIVTIERPLFEFYISLKNPADSMFGGHVSAGLESCPNTAFKTEFLVYDEDDNLIDVTVTIEKKSEGTTIASVVSGASEYLHEGNYVASTEIGSNAISRSFTVTDTAQIVKLTHTTCDGSISGIVKNAKDLTGIGNAEVSVFQGSVLCASTKTAADGNYQITLAEGSYKYVIEAENFVSVSGYISINDGETKYMESTLMAKDEDDSIMGGVFGTIKDAQTGLPLSDVNVHIYSGVNNTTGTSAATDIVDTTNDSGEYAYKMWSVFGVSFGLPAGNYTAVLSKDGYITTSFNLVVIAGQNTEFNGSISPTTAGNAYRAVLTWGENPRDLDSHVVSTLSSGESFHVYYGHKSQYDGSVEVCNLDVDDTTSYGPETITLQTTTSNPYYYYIYRYSGSGTVASSGAQINLYQGERHIATFNVPTNLGSGDYWNVFAIVNGELVVRNTITSSADVSYASADGVAAITLDDTEMLASKSKEPVTEETEAKEETTAATEETTAATEETTAATEETTAATEETTAATEETTAAIEETSEPTEQANAPVEVTTEPTKETLQPEEDGQNSEKTDEEQVE